MKYIPYMTAADSVYYLMSVRSYLNLKRSEIKMLIEKFEGLSKRNVSFDPNIFESLPTGTDPFNGNVLLSLWLEHQERGEMSVFTWMSKSVPSNTNLDSLEICFCRGQDDSYLRNYVVACCHFVDTRQKDLYYRAWW